MFYDSRPVGAVPRGASSLQSDVDGLLNPPPESPSLTVAERREQAEAQLIDLECCKHVLEGCIRQLREFLSVDPRQATFWDVPVDDDGLAA